MLPSGDQPDVGAKGMPVDTDRDSSGASRDPGAIEAASLKPARRSNLTDVLVAQLLELIAAEPPVERRLPPERVLSEQLAVSRASLREALAVLTHLGVLRTQRAVKYADAMAARNQLVARAVANEGSESALLEPLAVRQMLEPQVAAAAAQSPPPEMLANVARWLYVMDEAMTEPRQFAEADVAFHVAIACGTRNRVVIQLISALNDAGRDSRRFSYRPPDASRLAQAGHRAIYAALDSKDPAGAEEAMRAHLGVVEDLTLGSLSAGVLSTPRPSVSST